MAEGTFLGFPAETLAFLRGLAENNTKAWFEAHRADYQAHYVAPALAFVAALGPRLQQVAPGLQFEPRVNGSLFRINRDVRFSADKTPYKHYIDLWFWYGSRKGWDTPGFFFRLLPDALIAGAGMHKFTPDLLATYRSALAGPLGAELAALAERLVASGRYTLGEPELARLPRGVAVPNDREGLARRTGLHAMYEGPVPPEAASAAFVDWCLAVFQDLAPVNDWLLNLAGGRD